MASASEEKSPRHAAADGRRTASTVWSEGAPLPGDMLLLARPHLELRGEALVSIGPAEGRRRLSPAEATLWSHVLRSLTVREVLESCGPGADLLIRDFLRDGLCELVETAFPPNRRRVLIIEPHADDAVLSVGGTMWLRRHECMFVIATMASRSNHTRYRDLGARHDIDTVTEMRRRESQLVARMLGGEHVSIGMTDAALRYRDAEWTADFYHRHSASINASTARTGDEAQLRRWQDALQRLVREQQAAEIWFPLGGPHADHMLTADACLATWAEDPALVRDRVLRIYQEVPYAVRYPTHMRNALAAVRESGAVLEEECTAIAGVLEEKRRLASLYVSQDVEELFAAGGDRPEVFWRVRDLPRRAAAGIVSTAIARPALSADRAAGWVARNRQAPRVRVLLTTPTGRWDADLKLLSAALPRARFEVCTATFAQAEIVEAARGRVDLRTVPGGTWSWLLESLRVCFSRGAPTLLLAAPGRARAARAISRLWFGSDTLVVTSMDQLGSVLRIAPGED